MPADSIFKGQIEYPIENKEGKKHRRKAKKQKFESSIPKIRGSTFHFEKFLVWIFTVVREIEWSKLEINFLVEAKKKPFVILESVDKCKNLISLIAVYPMMWIVRPKLVQTSQENLSNSTEFDSWYRNRRTGCWCRSVCYHTLVFL